MNLSESIVSSFQNIFTHKLRSFLTLLGIIIGVFAVVTMFSTVYGMKKLINERMKEMGWNNSIIVYPSQGEENISSRRMYRFRHIQREAKPLTFEDYIMLKKNIKAKYIYGYIENWQKYLYEEKEEWVRLKATNIEFFLSKTYSLKSGRYFNSFEDLNSLKVCVIGYHFANQYFPNNDPLNKKISIGNHRYKIIGILADDKLNSKGMNFNAWERRHDLEAVYIPLSTGSKYLKSDKSIDYIYIQAKSEDDYQDVKNAVRQNLLISHKMSHDFSFNNIGAFMLNITKEINEMMKKWNITLSAIASISLIVGGIGLFSTLLISINERMKEIGIRKSIGATNRDIFLLFIFEAISLSILGAFIGIFFSSLLVKVIAIALKFNFPVPIEGILLGIAFSLIIGIVSGIYPAHKASKIDPIKAIYYFE
ncbi:MAG: ABC transporter permease [Candidatus Cloacimonetes bacterium]|nr:ABC transporter permease [Candidatus Cloacimonadota bacterium]